MAENAGDVALTKAYGVVAEEAKWFELYYEPETVNTDGWAATQNAWMAIFPGILAICCFLHVFIKIRDHAKMNNTKYSLMPILSCGIASGAQQKIF